MAYRCEALTVSGFVQQLAVSYIANGYYFYVAGEIPPHKDPARTDQKIIAQYGIGISKWARARRKKLGLANLHYLRFGRFYVIVASHGQHAFFEAEAKRLRDVRRCPIRFAGYSIGLRRSRGGRSWHASVRIERERFRELKAHFEEIAIHRSEDAISSELASLPFEPYSPVRNQLWIVLRAVNRRRTAAGFAPVGPDGVRRRRKSVKTFGEVIPGVQTSSKPCLDGATTLPSSPAREGTHSPEGARWWGGQR